MFLLLVFMCFRMFLHFPVQDNVSWFLLTVTLLLSEVLSMLLLFRLFDSQVQRVRATFQEEHDSNGDVLYRARRKYF